MRVRRNANHLTPSERDAFVQAVLALKRTQSPISPSLSYYDQFVHFHSLAVHTARLTLGYGIAHFTPSFLPWHRKLVLLFEDALRSVSDSDVTVPYWDWTDESSLAVIFSDDFLGSRVGDPDDNYTVKTGQFRAGQFDMNLLATPIGNNDNLQQCPFPNLTRADVWKVFEPALEAEGLTALPLPTTFEVEQALEIPRYDSPPYDGAADVSTSFRNRLQGNGFPLPRLHQNIHDWLGGSWEGKAYSPPSFESEVVLFVGSLTGLDASPTDPAFWLHHSNVDRIWGDLGNDLR